MAKKISQLPLIGDAQTPLTGDELSVAVIGDVTYAFKLSALRELVLNVDPSALGIDLIDNTSDEDKPLSRAARLALSGKSDKGHVHQISDIYGLYDRLDSTIVVGSMDW